MRILFVTDQIPYPPRSGGTIPIFNYISRLGLNNHNSLIILKDNGHVLDQEQLVENQRYANPIWSVNRSKKIIFQRLFGELTCQIFYFQGWLYNIDQIKRHLYGKTFDVIWIGRFVNTDIIEIIIDALGMEPIYVAGINDCATAMFRNMGKKFFIRGLTLRDRISNAIGWLRSWPIARIEAKILQKYNLILVQTPVELKWLNKISNGSLCSKTLVVSNGVNELLFRIPIKYTNNNILYLGRLDGEYAQVLNWIIENVWKRIKLVRPDVYFFIIGKNASKDLRCKMDKDKNIIYNEYIANINDIFKDKAIMLAPVFKNYGLINKVAESMAAGVPVIGDQGSFNGIPDFQNGQHGIIADNVERMAKAVLNLLDSPEKYFKMADSARTLIRNHFAWDDRIDIVNNKLEVLLQSKKTNLSIYNLH